MVEHGWPNDPIPVPVPLLVVFLAPRAHGDVERPRPTLAFVAAVIFNHPNRTRFFLV